MAITVLENKRKFLKRALIIIHHYSFSEVQANGFPKSKDSQKTYSTPDAEGCKAACKAGFEADKTWSGCALYYGKCYAYQNPVGLVADNAAEYWILGKNIFQHICIFIFQGEVRDFFLQCRNIIKTFC